MNNDKPDITDHLLATLAGQRAFERGEEIFNQGAVGALSTQGNKISAEVEGTETYRVNLTYTQKGLDGACNCPASDSIDFCKHCVATAMVLRKQLATPASSNSKKPADLISHYLKQKDTDFLVTTLTELIIDNKDLRQQWLIKAENAMGLLDKKTIRKRITAAIPYNRHYYKYHQVSQYFVTIENALSALVEPIEKLPGSEQIELIDYAMERIVKAQDTVDDSGGFRYTAEGLLKEMHWAAFKQLDWSDKKKVSYLIDTMINDNYRMHGEVPDDYQSLVSKDCLHVFYQEIQTRWDKLPRLTSDDWKAKEPYSDLLRVLEKPATAANDYARLILLNEKVAVNMRDYIKLAEWSIKLTEYDQAQSYIDQGKHCKENYQQDALIAVQQNLWIKTDKGQQAIDSQWALFKKNTHFRDYKALKSMAHTIGDTQDWFTLCIDHLKSISPNNVFRNSTPQLMMQIYLAENTIDEAYALSQHAQIEAGLLYELAKAVGENLERAVPLYTQLIKAEVSRADNESYRRGIQLLQALDNLSDTSAHKETIQTTLGDLRIVFKPKRNFIKWLNEAFPLKAAPLTEPLAR
ncbi:hypothetical protein N9V90_02900 [Endozoicomonas sp.]|nr:hypothetical protein [Endozoicomonas sp.]